VTEPEINLSKLVLARWVHLHGDYWYRGDHGVTKQGDALKIVESFQPRKQLPNDRCHTGSQGQQADHPCGD
jgi:hypothetical protein